MSCIRQINGTFREECLNVNWFLSMEDAREKIEKWLFTVEATVERIL